MKTIYVKLLEQIAMLGAEGKLGDAVQNESNLYSQLPLGIPTLLKFISNFYEVTDSEEQEIVRARDYFCQILVAVYKETKKHSPDVALAFINSLIEDFPNVPDSLLLTRWNSLANASLAFKSVAKSDDSLLIWQQASRQFLSYNEFLNGLLGFLIVSWRCVQGKKINPEIFKAAYANKAKHFSDISDGENGVFYLIHRIIRPKMRNAIAHETAWFDVKAGKVRYTAGRKRDTEYEMELIEFLSLTTLGSHLGSAYIAAIAAVIILEDGSEKDRLLLPTHLKKLFEH